MIIDTLDNAHRYYSIHPSFEEAFKYLLNIKDELFKDCPYRNECHGFAAIFENVEGKGREKAKLEAHQKFIDIQYTFSGNEEIGWKPSQLCTPEILYNSEKDIEFYSDRPFSWFPVPPNTFAIFFPEDGHAPMAGLNNIKKIIIKVPVMK